MEKPSTSNWKSLLFSMVIALAFLYFSFRNIDAQVLLFYMTKISPIQAMVLFILGTTGLLLRGLRWWYTLPRPLAPGELIAAERALSICYAVNLILPRAGELTRIVHLHRATGRSLTTITGSVILDRFLLDSLALAVFMLFALWGFKDALHNIFPGTEHAFYLMPALILTGIAAMVLFAARPNLVPWLMRKIGISKGLPSLSQKVENLFQDLARGMASIANPSQILIVLLLTVLIWSCYFTTFAYGLHMFNIQAPLGKSFFVYTITTIGFAIPSPGGVGTFHYFTKIALGSVLGTEETLAVAFATVLHASMTVISALAGAVSVWGKSTSHAREPAES